MLLLMSEVFMSANLETSNVDKVNKVMAKPSLFVNYRALVEDVKCLSFHTAFLHTSQCKHTLCLYAVKLLSV